MNRLSTLLAALALAASSASAQWKPDDKAFAVVGQDSIYGQMLPKTLRMTDGSIVVTWLKTPSGIKYSDARFGYYLYMQIYDKAGYPVLGKEGKAIVAEPTKTWVTDYGLQQSPDGNILVAYSDTRNSADRSCNSNYMYCYNTQGEPVWNAGGVEITSESTEANHDIEDLEPTLYTSGSNIYGMIYHSETYNVKADSTNWQPSEWYPEEEMPDSISIEEGSYQIMRYNADGSKAWQKPVSIKHDETWAYAGPDGGLYVLYVNNGSGFDARLIDKDGNDVWAEPVNVESGCVTNGSFTSDPNVVPDGKGGLVLAYRKLLSYSAYIVTNHLTPDGSVLADEFIPNGTMDGNAESAEMAVNGDRAMLAWSYEDVNGAKNLWVNQIDVNGDYTLEGDSLLGYSFDQNAMWGLTPVKVIAQDDGWVLLYGNCTSWNGATFYVTKMGFDGNMKWRRQIAEEDFKSAGFSVVNDDYNAYIFYKCDVEYDDNWNEIPGDGGLRVMCIDISGTTDGINGIADNTATGKAVYTISGVSTNAASAPGIYIVKENGKTHKIVKK